MTARFWTLLVAGLLVSACADTGQEENAEPGAAAAPEASADEAAIEQVRADYVAHYNQAHAPIVADLFTDSAYGLWAEGSATMGKPAIQASLQEEFATAPTPQLDIRTGDLMVFGDNAVGRGTYTVNITPPEGAAVTSRGNWLTHFAKVNGQWKINGVITNFNAPPPEGTPLEELGPEPPPDEGTMKEMVAAYAQAYNAGDWAAVANFYADDANVSFPNIEPLEGRAAIQARFTERFGTSRPQIEIHDVGTLDLGSGHQLDGGWYQLNATTPEGANITQAGTWMHLLQQQADGTWKIKWAVSNGNPKPAA